MSEMRLLRKHGVWSPRRAFLEARAWDRESSPSPDAFAHTFVAKCNMLDRWDEVVISATPEGEIEGAILHTVGKRPPYVANLQLLHVFAKHRHRGIATALVHHSLEQLPAWAKYHRVSSEPDAVDFYRSMGFRFWGRQKSGTLLSIARTEGSRVPRDFVYDEQDATIRAAVFSGRRGGCVEVFDHPH